MKNRTVILRFCLLLLSLLMLMSAFTGCFSFGEVQTDAELKDAFLNAYPEESAGLKRGDLTCTVFYDYTERWGRAIIVDLSVSGTAEAERVETVNGYDFRLPAARKLVFYSKRNVMYTLQEAIDKGVITDGVLGAIYTKYCMAHKYLYVDYTYDPNLAAVLPDEVPESEMKRVYVDQFDGKGHYTAEELSLDLYAKLGDAYALFVDGPFGYFDSLREVTVSGVTFTFGSSQRFYVYADRHYYTLEEAVDAGVLSDAEMQSLCRLYHMVGLTIGRNGYPNDFDTANADALSDRIKEAYLIRYENTLYPIDTEKLSLRFYGEFDGVYGLTADGLPTTPEAETEMTVGGVAFSFPDSQVLELYADGRIYSLREAYDGGLLNADELRQLQVNYEQAGGGSSSSVHVWENTGVSQSERERIETAWMSTMGHPILWCSEQSAHVGVRYCGRYDGYVLLLESGPIKGISAALYIEGVALEHDASLELYLYRDGEILSLREALVVGWITEGDLYAIRTRLQSSAELQ